MALVFKVKFEDTLRRWVAPKGTEALNTDSFTITFGQLEAKIRELFHFSPVAPLVITYLDKDNDTVTIADDQDLVDACVIQGLNPLRLKVQVLGGNSSPSEHAQEQPRSSEAPPMTSENVNIEACLNGLFPQATAEAVKGFMGTYTPFIDPKFPGAALGKVEIGFKDFLNGLASNQHGHSKFGERGGPGHPKKHPCPAMSGPHHHPHHGGANFHWGIVCDGCRMSPIEGPRYKATKESNYDLCANCFKTIGNENDYEKIDRPAHHPPPHGHYRPPCFRRGGPRPFMAPPPPGCRASFARGSYGWKPNHPFAGHQSSSFAGGDEHGKLDARFVKDVTIFDGTELSPGTKFTKIWRMSNIGTLPWPQNTQLVHIGGDVMSTEETVAVELPEGGLPCGEEVEVSADIVAPEKAGRYVSHWRLTAPSGQKFGHRVWVVIHVVPQGEHSPQFQASLRDGGEANKEAMEVDLDGVANTVTMDVDVDGVNKVVVDVVVDDETPVIEQVSVEKSGLNGHENTVNTIIYPDPTSYDLKMDASNTKYEVDGFSLVEKPTESTGWLDASNHGETYHTPEGMKEGMAEEAEHESLLQVLASMGFMDRNTNFSILRSRNFELQGAVDDLLAAAGWDGALKDLEEMGFSDKATNIRMLVKNKGSLKQTVRDLVKLEKEVVRG